MIVVERLEVVLTITLLGVAPSRAADVKALVVAEKNRVVANKDGYIILVLDLNPNLENLKEEGAVASDVIAATAANYAREYLAKKRIQPDPQGRCLPDFRR